MSDQTYTREELDKMNRLQLRRICKERGMSSDDAAKAHSDDMIAFILEAQGDGEKPKGGKKPAAGKKAPPKGGTKTTGAKGKDRLAAKKGGRTPPARGKAKTETEPSEPEGGDEATGEVAVDVSEMLVQLNERFDALEKRIDTIGEVVDQNFQDLTSDVGELRVDVHMVKGTLAHLGTWFENEEILTGDNAPEGLGVQEVMEQLEAECSGNDEGGEDENE